MNFQFRVVVAKVEVILGHEKRQNPRSIIRKSTEVVVNQEVRVKKKNEANRRNARRIAVDLVKEKRNGIDVHLFDVTEEENATDIVIAEVQLRQDIEKANLEVLHLDTDVAEHLQTGIFVKLKHKRVRKGHACTRTFILIKSKCQSGDACYGVNIRKP